MDFTEIRALKINWPAKVVLDPVKRMESLSVALVEFSVTNEGSPRSSEAHRIAVGRSRRIQRDERGDFSRHSTPQRPFRGKRVHLGLILL